MADMMAFSMAEMKVVHLVAYSEPYSVERLALIMDGYSVVKMALM
jgi:hypothetical protein